jgi:hypothetical protein
MTNNILTGKDFICLCLRNGFKSYQEIADQYNDGKIQIIKFWATEKRKPTLITQIGLYAIAKQEGWL